jgi:hypothetical protein
MKFAGVFKDDPDFAEIAESLRAERNTIDDDMESDRIETNASKYRSNEYFQIPRTLLLRGEHDFRRTSHTTTRSSNTR